MVATYEKDFDDCSPKSLNDWVRDFRIKRVQMKRKLRSGGDLRVCAILSTALISAENELRRKQQERFHRWSKVQASLELDQKYSEEEEEVVGISSNTCAIECRRIQREEIITNLWKCELSDLDEFMRTISSNNNSGVTVAS